MHNTEYTFKAVVEEIDVPRVLREAPASCNALVVGSPYGATVAVRDAFVRRARKLRVELPDLARVNNGWWLKVRDHLADGNAFLAVDDFMARVASAKAKADAAVVVTVRHWL